MKIGKAIKIYRVYQDMSQKELAEAAGLSVSYVSLMERNQRDPSISTLAKVAKALDTKLSDMIIFAEIDGGSYGNRTEVDQ